MADQDEITKKSRTLVLCFDGTSNQFDGDNTNVVKFFSLLKKDDFNEQLCYYQAGIGTWFNPGVVSPVFHWIAKVMDEAIAWYLDEHVMNGYRFLMQNYRRGDKICLFGFSRGAYTARALAGALYKVGLLPRDNQEQVPFAYKLYKREDPEGLRLCRGFKQTYCQSVKIEFVGVWDTVASVGVIAGRTLPFTSSNKAIRTFRHALSLDERRAKFKPNVYHRPSPNPDGAIYDPEHGSPIVEYPPDDEITRPRSTLDALLCKGKKAYYRHDDDEEGEDTDLLEVWFTGCHSDVGGGAVLDTDLHSLGNISLRWMVREVMKSQCGILFEQQALSRLNMPLSALPDHLLDRKRSVDKKSINDGDALQPIHDELKRNVLWWLLEIIPLSRSWQDSKGVWHRQRSINFGRGRTIYELKPNFHMSVKERMEDVELKYTPKAKWTKGCEVYID
ncbi:hypothetical protein AMATHDRAFT_146421 [Amanita thiersii Skay4041]|uniref:T6SS Phospholipase effector Tle1-like catalytic domain-containing protein n=1 Tax=Amanita thiersii Skay4041 TaxID=703135 RepID=A0A2A9NNP5_9AGAR|nr:hypothetical protein AMATHDRAFT_146421 [Amanita thiersii Skay4041]